MDSPFQQYLGTSYFPSIDETREIKKIVEASAKEVRDINTEIEELQKRIQLLEEKRSKVDDHLDQHQALISPVRRLGRDILEEIFIACLPENRNPCMSAAEAPMVLTHICSPWRTIAHLTPRLWAAIHIVLPSVCPASMFMFVDSYQPPSHSEHLVQLKLDQRLMAAKEWLDRSRACPLSVSVYQSPGVEGRHNIPSHDYDFALERDQQLHLSFVDNILNSYSKRWYEVDVCLSSQLINSLFENGVLTARRMQTLKKIHITSRTVGSPLVFNDPISITKWENIIGVLSSRLTAISLCGFPIYRSDLQQIPQHAWEHLTDMNLDAWSNSWLAAPEVSPAKFASAVIYHCRSLKTLKLDIHFSNANDILVTSLPDDAQPVILPHLTSLSFRAIVSLETMRFVKHLYIPSLKELDLELSDYYIEDSTREGQEILATLLHDCGDGLESLGLYNPSTHTSAGNMVQLLQLVPNLKCLKFFSSGLNNDRWRLNSWSYYASPFEPQLQIINDDLLSALSPLGKDYSDIICPSLEVLESDWKVSTKISASALKEFLNARKYAHFLDQRIATLQCLDLYIDDPNPTEEMEKEIQTLVEKSNIHFRTKREIPLSPWEGL